MDAFKLRNNVVDDYLQYVNSFLKILDTRLENYVRTALVKGILWPDPLIQLSPAYKPASTVQELVTAGLLHPLCGEIFRAKNNSLRLHQHQRTALDIARDGHNYVVTTGTGSGKSLTYMLPIVDNILKNKPEQGKVRAIIVYPMNALINSQEQALGRFFENLATENLPVRYKRYTGQESDEQKRAIQANPPHILLTNYVMLELMLTRPEERPFVEAASSALQFLVLDELHTYRGRQGADVALLVRRLREISGNEELQCIGTSATMSSGGTRLERNQTVADVASRIFGSTVKPEHVIDETLQWSLPHTDQPSKEALTKALKEELPDKLSWAAFVHNPLAVWIEENFGLEEDIEGRLHRHSPETLMAGAIKLEELTGSPKDDCAKQLRKLFNLGSKVASPTNNLPGFAFKLHQFFSQGGSVHATIENPADRYLTLEGQHYAPARSKQAATANATNNNAATNSNRIYSGSSNNSNAHLEEVRVLFPLVFCRECGQEHYLCTLDERQALVLPRSPLSREINEGGDDDENNGRPRLRDGYLLVDTQAFWPDDHLDLLPENWFKELKSGLKVKPEYQAFLPRKVWVKPDGAVIVPTAGEDDTAIAEKTGAVRSWFIPTPFLTCLRCGEIYTKRQKADFGKLARLSSEGRSTATSLLTISVLHQMQQDSDGLPLEAQKLMSFTDNRQDASLQAGHFNDFVEVAVLRAAIYQALAKTAPNGIDHLEIAQRTVAELNLPESKYAKEASPSPTNRLARENRKALQSLIEYRIYEDLRRGWRVTQPNLEQCGLLVMEYDGLEEVCEDAATWQTSHPLLAECTPTARYSLVRNLLDYMRKELALTAECLDRSHQESLIRTVRNSLKEPWAFDENEVLYSATKFVLPGVELGGSWERSLGANTSLGRYVRSRNTCQGLETDLKTAEYKELMNSLVEVLRGNGYLLEIDGDKGKAVQLRSDALRWKMGNGTAIERDIIRTRRMKIERPEITTTPNKFFAKFYKTIANNLQGIEGHEHTGQVRQEDREKREQAFRTGELKALFCSPTMELGIDISDLNTVHLRNVPPTPANYAQRSGRAGRSGQPAFVATYCSVGSGHDQYFWFIREFSGEVST